MSMVFTDFTLTITASNTEIATAEEFMKEFIEEFDPEHHGNKACKQAVYVVEECIDMPYPSDAEAFAVQLAKLIPEASFSMECTNIDERSGGPFEFRIAYADRLITSDAYAFDCEPMTGEEFSYNYPDYEYFCEEFTEDETGECPYSEEEYNTFCSAEILFISDRILTEFPGPKTYPVD